jgi:nucleoside-diphosphate kinase
LESEADPKEMSLLRRAALSAQVVMRAGARQKYQQQHAASFATAAASRGAGGGGAAWAAGAAAAIAAAASWSATLPLSAAAEAAAAKPPPPQERTFIAVKPDGVERRLVAEIMRRFEQRGYRLAAAKVVVPPRALADEHYAEHRGKPFQPGLVDFLSSGPVFAMVWEGDGVVKQGRAMLGATNPQASPPGTIRGDYGVITSRNICHASDAVESAQREIALWFRPEEIVEGHVPTDSKHTQAHG